MRWLPLFVLLVTAACKEKTPAEVCKEACAQLTACNDVTMLERLDCTNGCAKSKAYDECPGCLAGSHGTCNDIAEGRVCNSSCRAR